LEAVVVLGPRFSYAPQCTDAAPQEVRTPTDDEDDRTIAQAETARLSESATHETNAEHD